LSNVNVKLPYDIISIIGAHKNIENESKILIATELYREGEISSGKAAELADLPFEGIHFKSQGKMHIRII
jgi:predicted HTH domain antitoxin